MELAAEENLIGFFLFSIEEVGDLYKEIFKLPNLTKTNITPKFIENLKLAIQRKDKPGKIGFEAGLSTRELDALKLIAEDLSNREIADKLFISLQTVKTHVKNILLKLEVESRIRAVSKAKELGII
jgi:LuxR family maltose regulon positive regulatory protein